MILLARRPRLLLAISGLGLVALSPPLSALAPAEAPPPETAAGAAEAGSPTAEAAFQFGLAKMLMDEGDYRAATTAFERALELDPQAAYVRLEYAEFLARLGRFGRSREARLERLREAVSHAEAAQRALGNTDALRVVAEASLALAAEVPEEADAMATAVAALEGIREEEPGDVRSMLQLGQIYLRQGEADAAVGVFREIVYETPGYRPVYRMLAEALIQAGRTGEAGDALRKVIEDEPDAEAARLALAEILSDDGEHRQAAEILSGAPAPLESPEARSRLATELYLAGELDGALEQLDRLVADLPDSRYFKLLRGLVLSAQARNEEALAALEPLVGKGPGEANLAMTVSQLLLRQERDDEAVDLLKGTLEHLEEEGPQAEAVDARLALAQLYATLDRWGVVEATVAPLLSGGEEAARAEATLLYADALAEQGRGKQALDALRASEEPPFLAKRAELLAKLGREREALDILHAAAAGDSPDAFLGIAEGLHRAEHFEATIAPLETFVTRNPDATAGRFLLGAAQERAGRRADAVATFRGLLADQPDFHPALNYLGYMWIEQGEDLDRALGLIRHAVDLDPDNGAYVDSLGWGYYRLGRFEEAREQLERAARLIQDSTVYEHLGDVYAALGEPGNARRAYQRAMKLEADDPEEVARKLTALEDRPGEDAPDLQQPR
jgi:predicted Zn-dependent protease